MATTDAKVIVFDIDGTLANIEHRREHVQNGRRNWKKFNEKMVDDTPYADIVWLFQTLDRDCIMVIASGRGEEDREKTENWLNAHSIHCDKLYMRPAKDNRKDSIIKKEILDQIVKDYGVKPFMVFDDRNQVVDMWRENGIRCCQVAPGDF
jgi:FMN phosphatase YigB (HAD superfamily)